MKPPAKDHQSPLRSGATKDVGLAMVTMGQAAGRETAECSCGWVAWHRRLKVLEDKIDKHLDKMHDGRGIRL